MVRKYTSETNNWMYIVLVGVRVRYFTTVYHYLISVQHPIAGLSLLCYTTASLLRVAFETLNTTWIPYMVDFKQTIYTAWNRHISRYHPSLVCLWNLKSHKYKRISNLHLHYLVPFLRLKVWFQIESSAIIKRVGSIRDSLTTLCF
jgi:hypothetical protein